MIFTSAEYALFLALVLPLFFALRGQARKVLLLLSSYWFYGTWSIKFLLLLCLSTFVDYHVARLLDRATAPARRRSLLLLSLSVNLGALAFFKYANFFIDSATPLLTAVGLSSQLHTLSIVLPVGISFYTFQELGYILDVYWRKSPAEPSLLNYAMYTAFFPQLVAGPIERAPHLIPQLSSIGAKRSIDLSGAGLIAIGAFKKVVIADNFANLVNAIYQQPQNKLGGALWLGTYAFAIQIYCDFSGYSDIAVGSARLLGVEVMENFNAPYAATGPADFWGRWHISLSTWLRDYLYIPLGGNRGGEWFTTRNLMITMLLGGLWHGAAWNYVLWGGYQGLLLIVCRSRVLNSWGRRLEALISSRVFNVGRKLIFFHLVCLGWALFRARSLADCATLWRKLLLPGEWQLGEFFDLIGSAHQIRYVLLIFTVTFAIVLGQNVFGGSTKAAVAKLWATPPWVRFATCSFLLYSALVLTQAEPPPFIYFQF
ncbi:MAG TPA: MBOAT family O-acyltransferase [Polyangiaceae bacterium]|nr:MBOAT family O-acyltransferase [Polyangiaceae bacterium]